LGLGKLLRTDVRKKSRCTVLAGEWLSPRMRRPFARLSRLRRGPSQTETNAPSPAREQRIMDRYVVMVDWCLRHRFLCGLLLVPAVIGVSFFALQKVPDNSPEAQDLQNLNIQYEFSENYYYAKIEQHYV